jgi:hypothetical protein
MSTIQLLQERLGQPLDRRNRANIWRFGFVYQWSPVSEAFVQGELVSIRPDQTLCNAEKAADGFIAIIDK